MNTDRHKWERLLRTDGFTLYGQWRTNCVPAGRRPALRGKSEFAKRSMKTRKLSQIKPEAFTIPDLRFTSLVFMRAVANGLRTLVAGESGVAAAALPPHSKTRWVGEVPIRSGCDRKFEISDLKKGQ